tara:strand:+ start:15369 stop:15908 length:540 start_codon:yes stop_codon:yes gene_type:complete
MSKELMIGVKFKKTELESLLSLLKTQVIDKEIDTEEGNKLVYLWGQLDSILTKAVVADVPESALKEVDSWTKPKELNVVEKMEIEYSETMDEFKRINQAQYNLFALKQADYGPGNISMNGNKELALLGLGVRMNDKTQRILNLTHGKSEPNNESLEDSFKDLSVYGIIAQIVLADLWGK